MGKTLVTGVAGFIGFHVAKRLLEEGRVVVGIDSLNDYYDVTLKTNRLSRLLSFPQFKFVQLNLADGAQLRQMFEEERFDDVINLAAQAGVRYSLINPDPYVRDNLVGFTNVLESCRKTTVQHLVFASSSSVYGADKRMPFSVHNSVDHPVSFYGATKKANELMAHAYSHLYGLPCTGLRFFSVYGPWGRPDMALFLFTKAILEDRPIDVFNHGNMKRDFTYIDDAVEVVMRVLKRSPQPNPLWRGEQPDCGSSQAPYRLYNVSSGAPVQLPTLIALIEQRLGKKAQKHMLPLQAGDVPETFADIEDLARDIAFRPNTSLAVGIDRFVTWYLEYYVSRPGAGP